MLIRLVYPHTGRDANVTICGPVPLVPPDPLDPSLRFSSYIVELGTLAYAGADHVTPEQLKAAQATNWIVMTKDELLEEWRRRASSA